jgi:hypothetical protein
MIYLTNAINHFIYMPIYILLSHHLQLTVQ